MIISENPRKLLIPFSPSPLCSFNIIVALFNSNYWFNRPIPLFPPFHFILKRQLKDFWLGAKTTVIRETSLHERKQTYLEVYTKGEKKVLLICKSNITQLILVSCVYVLIGKKTCSLLKCRKHS